jgi:hypothetical protein
VLAAAIDALSDCAQACIADVDADLSEPNEHCRVCEQACRRCEQACRELLGALK